MAKILFGINAAIAWIALALSLTLNLSGYYVDRADASKPTILGNVPGGIDTPLERLLDWSTFFTIWSNATVAVVMTMLVARPALFTRADRVGAVWRTLRIDSVMMIAVTGVVFNLLLASEKSGIDAVSNFNLHILVPCVTVLVWLIAGPRGLINVKVIFASLILPIIWLVYALVRGAAVGAYPYPFLDVATKGMASVLQFVVAIVIAALVLAFAMRGFDALVKSVARRAR